MRHFFRIAMTAAMLAAAVLGQPAQSRAQAVVAEGQAGYAGFVDESLINHLALSGSVRRFVSPRIAVGPEFLYMKGPGSDHDWSLLGTATFDLTRPTATARVVPYLIASGGFTRQTTEVGTGTFTSTEGALAGGAGVRLAFGKLYIAPEVRIGWEPLLRVGVSLGWR